MARLRGLPGGEEEEEEEEEEQEGSEAPEEESDLELSESGEGRAGVPWGAERRGDGTPKCG